MVAYGVVESGADAALRTEMTLVLENPGRQDLTVNKVAAAQNVSPGHIQMPFEAEGATFSAFMLQARLAQAHRILSNARFADQPIGVIALDAGFGDLSYFNRVFHRTYSETPSGVRNEALRQ